MSIDPTVWFHEEIAFLKLLQGGETLSVNNKLLLENEIEKVKPFYQIV